MKSPMKSESIPLGDRNYKKNKNPTFQEIDSIKKRKAILCILFFCLFLIMLFLYLIKNKIKIIKDSNYFRNINIQNMTEIYNKLLLKSNMTVDEEIYDCQLFVNKAVNHTLINPNEIFYSSENPKISVVIPLYNAEGYIENGICAIENQDFKDIEIIIIDDKSKDNSVEVVKQLMQRDPRINLYQNKETKGTLYSKSIGVTYSKGKYVLVSDQDDLYTQEVAFSTMYYQLEKDNLDILGFGSIFTKNHHINNNTGVYFFFNSPVYHQPYISSRMYHFKKNNTVGRIGDVIWNYIYKTEVFKKSISQIDDKIMNTRMNCHEDFLLFFLLTRNAKSLKNIKRTFYAHIYWVNATKKSILFAKKEKETVKRDYKCLSFINYIEFLLYRTKDTVKDKRIASYELKNWFLNNECKNNAFIQERAKNVCKLYLENPYIEQDIKEQISQFFNTTK